MTSIVQVKIDLNETGLDLEPAAMEEFAYHLAEELNELTEEAGLVRDSEIPDDAMSAAAGFLVGIVTAKLKLKQVKALLDFLGDRFYGKPLQLKFEANGKKYELEYRNQQQLETAIQAIQQLAKIE